MTLSKIEDRSSWIGARRFAKVLVPVDYSEYSQALLEYVVDLARPMHSEVIVLHVVEPELPANWPQTAVDAGPSPCEDPVEYAHTYLQTLQPCLHGIRYRTIVREGRPACEIMACAADVDADVIVMATHGRRGLARFLTGSTTGAVVRQVQIPVLTIRHAVLTSALAALHVETGARG